MRELHPHRRDRLKPQNKGSNGGHNDRNNNRDDSVDDIAKAIAANVDRQGQQAGSGGRIGMQMGNASIETSHAAADAGGDSGAGFSFSVTPYRAGSVMPMSAVKPEENAKLTQLAVFGAQTNHQGGGALRDVGSQHARSQNGVPYPKVAYWMVWIGAKQ